MKSQEQRDSLRSPGERRLRRQPGPAQPGAREQAAALCKIGWKEKSDRVVGAGTAARASDQISDCFLPEGAGNREAKKGEQGVGGESRLVPASSFLSLPACQGMGEPSTVLSKRWCVFFLGPKIKEPWNEPTRNQA